MKEIVTLKRLRFVYAALRRELGFQFSARDLLNAAAKLIEITDSDIDDELLDFKGGSVPDHAREVDAAMLDSGGWWVFHFESQWPEPVKPAH